MSSDPTSQLPPGPFQPLAPGTLLQRRYRIETLLGKGGMGHVYGARDERFEALPLRSVKEMIPRLDDRQHQSHMVNFKREAEVLESLRHERIPRVYDYFEEYRRAYLVLEYVDGQDLEQTLDKTSGPLNPHTVGGWVMQLCEIVDYLHSRNPPVIFRDLKPSNVILTPRNQIYLIDFGIAKVFQQEEVQTNVGTQGYAAPEQYERRAEVRSDVYALGAMMHHLLTKSDPRLSEPFTFKKRPIIRYNTAVTPELDSVIMKALAHYPQERYQSVSEFRDAVAEALNLPADTGFIRRIHRGGGSGVLGKGVATGPVTTGFARSPRLRWSYKTEEEVRSTPTIANGTLYIGSYDNNLYALDLNTGKYKWRFTTEGGICGRAAAWKNLIVFGSEDYYVYGIEALSGKEAWRYRTHHHVRSSPCVHEDKVYIGSDDAHLHAINPANGRAIWQFRAFREIQTTPACGNEMVYFGSNDELFYAVDSHTGDRKWSFRTQAPVISSPALAEGNLYFGSMDFGVYSIDAKSGWQAWREPTDRFVISSPLVVGDKVYVGSADRNLYCLDRRTGRSLWKYPAGQQITSSPACANGVVYFGCVDGFLYALSADTGKLQWRYETGGKITGSPVVHEGVVYIGSTDWNVYALEAIP